MRKHIAPLNIGWIYAYAHFATEVACFYFLFSRLNDSPIWWGLALLFDALAFIPQGVIGLIADKYPRFNYGLLGSIMIVIAMMLPTDIIALVILCLGNAIVHIGGAQQTLRTSGGRIASTSIFVGGGSFGVITGQLLAQLNRHVFVIIPIALMLVSVLLLAYKTNYFELKTTKWEIDVTTKNSEMAIICVAFIVIAIRAYIGYAIPTEWNKTEYQAILLFFIMGCGKIVGGFLADCMGCYKTALISSIASIPFLLFGNSIMILSLVGVGLFSMTMPVTISILVSKFPQQPCFSFGITTVALFVGTFPAFFVRPTTLLAHQLTVLILIVIAILGLLFCIEKRGKYEHYI